jgi:hypothetical protein
MRKTILGIASLILTGCATVGPTTPYVLSAADVETVESTIRYQMKDAASAQFRDLQGAKSASGDVLVCGWVNGRNSFGGYTGFMPFAGRLGGFGFSLGMLAADNADANVVAHQCRQAGLIM